MSVCAIFQLPIMSRSDSQVRLVRLARLARLVRFVRFVRLG